jgi:hypothetical protein
MRTLRIGAGLLAGAALLAAPTQSQAAVRIGVGVFLGHPDYRYGYGYNGYGYNRDTFRIGYERGVQDGAEHGRHDGWRNESFDFVHDRRYRCGDAGYHRDFGPKDVYVNGYRRGYEEAYRSAYRDARHERYDRDDHYDRDDRYRRY